MIRRLALAYFLLWAANLAAARGLAVGPVTGETLGLSTNEIELRLPIILSRALKKITLKNTAAARFIFPNEFAEGLKSKGIEPKAIYSLQEYEKMKGFVDGGGIITVELLPSQIDATARLNYFDYASYATTSVQISGAATQMVFLLAKQFMQLEAHRTALGVVKPGAKLALITALKHVEQNSLMLHLMESGYGIASISEPSNLGTSDLAALREVTSNGISYRIPRSPASNDTTKLTLSPANDEAEETFMFDTTVNQQIRYVEGFNAEITRVSSEIQNKTGADYLLVFAEDGKRSFARAFELKTGNMVWLQDGFPEAASSSLPDIMTALTKSLTTPPPEINTDQFKMELGGAKPGVAGQSGGLASVAILDFYDRTNSRLFGYLSSSLSQAVDGSMQNIFEFQRADSAVGNSAGTTHLKGATEAQKSALKAFQKQTGADYLIYGDYVYDKKTKKVTIRAQAYDLIRVIPVSTQSLESSVDASLFTAVDQIAERIVQDILLLAQQ